MFLTTLVTLLFIFCLLMNMGILASVIVVELFLVMVFWLKDAAQRTHQSPVFTVY